MCKGGDFTFGYKAHAVSDPNGLFIGIHPTAANVNEISNLEEVIANVPLEKGTRLYGDKGYRSEKNEKLLKEKGLKNGIMYKKSKGKHLRPLTRCYSSGDFALVPNFKVLIYH